MPILHSLNTLPLPSPPLTHTCRQWRRSQLSAHRRPLTARTCCSCSTRRAALGNQRAWSTLRPAISYMRHLRMKCVCVCASVHVSVCMSELCGVCHPCVLSWCLTVTRGTSMRVWLTLAGSPATHMWSTAPSAMESPLFCLRVPHSIQTQVRGEGRELEEGGEGTRGEREGGEGKGGVIKAFISLSCVWISPCRSLLGDGVTSACDPAVHGPHCHSHAVPLWG